MIIVSGALIALAVIVNIFGATRLAPLLLDGALSSLTAMPVQCRFAHHEFGSCLYGEFWSLAAQKWTWPIHSTPADFLKSSRNCSTSPFSWLGSPGPWRYLECRSSWRSGLISKFTLAIGNLSITIGGIVLFCLSVLLSFWIAKLPRRAQRR